MKADKSSRLILLLFLISIAIIVLQRLHALKPLENILIAGFNPIQTQILKISDKINQISQNNQTIEQLRKENQELVQENLTLNKDKTEKVLLQEENEFLKSQLNLQQENPQIKFLQAHITGQAQQEGYQIFFINQGTQDQVQVGDAVVVENGILIGKIIETNQYSSSVLLLNDSYSSTAAAILNQDKTIGLINGKYGLGMVMELIPQNEQINENDTVITSGMEKGIPRGLLIGKVGTIVENPGELFKSATIKPFVPYNKVYHVNVLIPQKTN